MKHIFLSLAVAFLLIGGSLFLIAPDPAFAQARGIVPCSGPDCQVCHLTILAQNVIEFLVRVAFIVAALAFAVAGFFYFTTGANPGNVEKAHAIFKNTFIGLIFVLGSWLIIDVILHVLAGEGVRVFTQLDPSRCGSSSVAPAWQDPDKAAPWQDPDKLNANQGTSGTGGTAQPWQDPDKLPQAGTQPLGGTPTLGTKEIDARLAKTAPYASQNCSYAEQANIDNCNATRAVMAMESAGNPKAQEGNSRGLMQVEPATARQMDPSLRNLSDAQIQSLLVNNPDKNMELGNKYYGQLYTKYGDYDLTTAAYNGGTKANEPSKDCPGLHKWECVWDSPGCYGTGKTDCKRNEGVDSYEPTRKYVPNVRAARERLDSAGN